MPNPPQIGVVQKIQGTTAVGNTITTPNISTATGNLLVAIVQNVQGANPATSVKNAAGVSFTQVPGSPVAFGIQTIQIFYLKNITGNASDNAVATFASAPNLAFVYLYEVNNADTTSPYLLTASGTGSSTSLFTSSFSPASDCIVVGGSFQQGLGSPITEISGGVGIFMDDSVAGPSGGDGSVFHTFFAGGASGITIGLNSPATPNGIIAVAFKAAAGMGLKTNIVCVGDSITAGFGITTPWPSLLALNATSQIFNIGVPGETLATMVSTASANVDPKLRFGMTNICTIWGGTNDITNGDSLVTLEGNLSTFIAARKAAGWTVISIDTVDRSGGGGSFTTIKDGYNAYQHGLPSGLNASVVLPSTLVAAGASTNLTFFQADQIHPTQFSATTIEAPLISAAINSVLSNGAALLYVLDSSSFDFDVPKRHRK